MQLVEMGGLKKILAWHPVPVAIPIFFSHRGIEDAPADGCRIDVK